MDIQPNYQKTWFNRAKETLEAKGLRQKDLAHHLGIAEKSVNNYLNGNRDPNTHLLKDIALYLGVSAGWLLTGTESHPPMKNGIKTQVAPFLSPDSVLNWIVNGEANEGVVMIDSWLPLPSDRCYFMDVPDDAMLGEAGIKKNDSVLVNPDEAEIDGNIVVIKEAADIQPIARRLMISGSRKYLTADNQRFPTIEWRPEYIYCGTVINSIRNHHSPARL